MTRKMFRVKETISQFEETGRDAEITSTSSISDLSDYVSDQLEKRPRPNWKPHENRVRPRIEFYLKKPPPELLDMKEKLTATFNNKFIVNRLPDKGDRLLETIKLVEKALGILAERAQGQDTILNNLVIYEKNIAPNKLPSALSGYNDNTSGIEIPGFNTCPTMNADDKKPINKCRSAKVPIAKTPLQLNQKITNLPLSKSKRPHPSQAHKARPAKQAAKSFSNKNKIKHLKSNSKALPMSSKLAQISELGESTDKSLHSSQPVSVESSQSSKKSSLASVHEQEKELKNEIEEMNTKTENTQNELENEMNTKAEVPIIVNDLQSLGNSIPWGVTDLPSNHQTGSDQSHQTDRSHSHSTIASLEISESLPELSESDKNSQSRKSTPNELDFTKFVVSQPGPADPKTLDSSNAIFDEICFNDNFSDDEDDSIKDLEEAVLSQFERDRIREDEDVTPDFISGGPGSEGPMGLDDGFSAMGRELPGSGSSVYSASTVNSLTTTLSTAHSEHVLDTTNDTGTVEENEERLGQVLESQVEENDIVPVEKNCSKSPSSRRESDSRAASRASKTSKASTVSNGSSLGSSSLSSSSNKQPCLKNSIFIPSSNPFTVMNSSSKSGPREALGPASGLVPLFQTSNTGPPGSTPLPQSKLKPYFTIKKKQKPNAGFRPVLPKPARSARETQKISFEEVSEIFSKMRLSSENNFKNFEGDLTKLGQDEGGQVHVYRSWQEGNEVKSFNLSASQIKKGFKTTANNQPIKVGEGMEDLD